MGLSWSRHSNKWDHLTDACGLDVSPTCNSHRTICRLANFVLDLLNLLKLFAKLRNDLNARVAVLISVKGHVMTAQIVSAWATQNGFNSLDSWTYRRSDDVRTITIEIKKLSVVLIDERAGLRPRIISTLFKDLFFGGPTDKLERLLRDR